MKKIIIISMAVVMTGAGLFAFNAHKKSERGSFELNILSIGDSITSGMEDEEGTWATNYNFHLYSLLTKAGYRPRFLGSHIKSTNGPEPISDEGYGSYCIAENWQDCKFASNENTKMNQKVLEDNSLLLNLDHILIQSHTPKIIILQGGINDIGVNQNNPDNNTIMGNPAANMLKMAQRVKVKYPDALIVILPVFAYQHKEIEPAIEKFNSEVLAGVKTMKNAIFVELPNFNKPDNFFTDGIHPTEIGYAEMGEKIYEEISKQKLLP